MTLKYKDPDFCDIFTYSDKPFLEIRARKNHSVGTLKAWIKKNEDILKIKLSTVGGLLFRGFDIDSPEKFEVIAKAIEPNLCKTHDFDDGARTWLTDYIYEASLGSIIKDQIPLSFHNEDAFVPYVPSTIMLCALEPSAYGGETLLADCRKVFQSFPKDLQEKFLGFSVKSSFSMEDSIFLVNTHLPKNVKAIQHLAQKYGATNVYRVGDFRTRFTFVIPTVIHHENTKEPIWFSRVHQAVTLSRIVDIWHSYKYRKSILSLLEGFMVMVKTIFNHYWLKLKSYKTPEDQKNLYTFSNGTPIPLRDQFKICSSYWKNAVIEPLNAGDVIVLDNRLVTHGRLPYKGKRRLLSCIGNQIMVKNYATVTS